MTRCLTLCALLIPAALISGCARPAPLVEYRYVEANCTAPAEVLAAPVWQPVRWVTVEVNGTILSATPDGWTLFSNIKGLQ